MADLPADPPPAWFSTDGLGGGILVASVAAVLATVIWYAVVAFSSYQIGFVATLVGYVIGQGAVIGARGRGSIYLSVFAAVLTVLALGISQYLIGYHVVTEATGMPLDLFQPIEFIVLVVVESLIADPLTLLFWAFAIGAAAYVPFKAIKPQTAPPIHHASPMSPI